MTRKWSGLYAAWFASNGRSYYPTPQRVYVPDEDWGGTVYYWHKDGNDAIAKDNAEGFSLHDDGGFVYSSKSRAEVELVIDAARHTFLSICNSWGLVDANLEADT